MTVQEAKMQIQAIPSKIWEQLSPCDNEAMGIAIECMEEVEQYRALGTVEELKEAREKQVAKKRRKEKLEFPVSPLFNDIVTYKCGNCGADISCADFYCAKCGNKIDWSDSE